ncbi:MAG: tRNA preQ1(34) S-adenosylmethionine ribosyltransferase-isomerase QueA [Candidatus Sericytochromatia bacterium]|nr:tRNA preQ1(34) S-adenosylmethionine ribosyltransferase-isomerase QueA [Candidatus Tanganyikabacteria bacterium]
MRLSDFDYSLPEELIAQQPAARRDESRLLALCGPQLRHLAFRDLRDLLRPGDLLVVNDTRVLPARLFGTLPGGGRAEVLLIEEVGARTWSALVRPGRKLREGAAVAFGETTATVTGLGPDGERILCFEADPAALMATRGRLPLPPYIHQTPEDETRYQTVFAERPGAIAAPTAGLHFTGLLLAELAGRGVGLARVTLHVGPGTFRPVQVEDVSLHRMHAERYEVPEAAARAIAAARAAGGRVVAVGTTVVRTLEAAAGPGGGVSPGRGATDLFIRPGFEFRVVDALVTNFHLPRSTLLMLVAAFAEHAGLGGGDRVLAAYAAAVAARYRFFSFGDAMFLSRE